tara:strand:+ start:3446 stop:3973 length:528 start_codon:yes stop_codon:yes gene_type:complete
MTDNIEIRESEPRDVPLIKALYPMAFPDEDLLPLVKELLEGSSTVHSLVAIVEGGLVGHIIFTVCEVAGKVDKVALLGPLAVAPAHQRQGIGSVMVKAGLTLMENAGVNHAFVLGDPAYYGRFGFEPDDGVMPPYQLPDEWRGAWQSLSLNQNKTSLLGKLVVTKPWRQKTLWVS